jgi:SAM-dependent methyltransferase
MTCQLEVRVPISPTPDFFRRVHFMATSLRRLQGSIESFVLVVCVGGDVEPEDLCRAQPWSRHYPIVWRWADRELFRRDSFWETSREIFRQPIRGRFVICADADVLFMDDFSDLLRDLESEPAVAGVIAHAPPFQNDQFAKIWRQLSAGYHTRPPLFEYEHTGWGFMVQREALRFTPPYFNFGMVAAPAGMMEIISVEIEKADDFVNANLDTFFRFQIALTLTIQKHGLPVHALPLRYNFPNDPSFDAKYPEELSDVRILHYLRCEIIHRESDFRTLNSVASLIARQDLTGSNEVFRRRVAELYPFVREEEARPSHAEKRVIAGLRSITVPHQLQRNALDVLADGVGETGQSLLEEMARRMGRANLAGLDLLDIGCGVRFTQTLINRYLPFASYTGIEVYQPIVDWLTQHVESHDRRFKFVHWDVRNLMYNPNGRALGDHEQFPITDRYDVVMGFSLFTHLAPDDSTAMLRLMRKAVRADGFLFFSAFCDDAVKQFEDRVPERPLLNAYYNRRYLERLIREAAWEVLSYAEPAGYMMDSFLCKPVA